MKKFTRFTLTSLLGLLGLFLFAGSAFAAGGTCPTGANYIDPTSPQTGGGLGSVTLSSLGVTSCYFISAAGSDSNNGTTESTPWLHAPGMPSCSGTCASTTPAAGEGFIFRGGDTWHEASGSPGIGGDWSWTHSGSGGSPIYIGIDLTWFAGGSFARPILSEDNTVTNSSPGSCAHADDGTTFVDFGGQSNVIFDGFELTGDCTSGASDGNVVDQGDFTIAERLYMHGWSMATTASDDSHVLLGRGNGNNPNDQDRSLFNVIDGADSTFGNVCTTPSCVGSYTDTGGAATAWGMSTCWDVEYSIIRHTSQGLQCGDASIFHDNLMEYIFEPNFGGRHGNVFEVTIDGAGSLCSNFVAYNNVTRNTNNGVGWWIQCPSYWIFNNVWSNSGHFPPDGNGLLLSPPGSSGSSVVTAHVFNNTFQANSGGAGPSNSATPAWAAGSHATLENNHIMDFTTIGTFFPCSGDGNSCTLTDSGGEVFQTTATANGQGYTVTNDWRPTSGASATVGAGTNLTSLCATVPDTAGATACTFGTTGAVTETSAWGGKFSSFSTTLAGRPSSGAWNAGAYQLGGADVSFSPSSVSFPSTVVSVTSSPITVTMSNPGGASLTGITVSITGTNASNFAQTNTCSTLAVSASCTISVTFTPSTTGSRTANLSISDSATSSPQTVALSGTGVNTTPTTVAGNVFMRQVLPNAGTTGTTVNTLTKITGNPSTLVIAAITDTSGVLGITVSGAGTTGNATIQLAGPIPCVFDGATTAGDYVQISSSVAGNCHDAGATFPTGNQVIGRVQSTNGSGGTYTINLYPAEINATAGSGGSVASVFGRVGIVVSATNDYNFNQLAGSADCSQEPALTGDTTSSAGSCATTTSGINGTAFSGTNGDVVSFGASNTPADSGIPAANVVTQTSNAASGQICTYTGTNKVCVPSAALPNGVTATTQAASDNSTKVATTAYADRIAGGAGTVTSIATTSPIGGGTITGTGTLTCATCVVASSPGAGIARFAGSTQTVTSAELSGDVTTSGSNVTTVANVAGTAAATVKIRDFGTTFGDTTGSALTSGSIVYFTVPYACTIAAWNITVDAGTVTFDIWKIATGSAVPTVSNSITASAQPAISSGTAVHSTTMTGWGAGTTVTANDIFGIQLKTVATAKFAELDIQCNQ